MTNLSRLIITTIIVIIIIIMTYFQSEVDWNWFADSWGSDSLSVVD